MIDIQPLINNLEKIKENHVFLHKIEITPQNLDKQALRTSTIQKRLYKAEQFLTEKALPRLK